MISAFGVEHGEYVDVEKMRMPWAKPFSTPKMPKPKLQKPKNGYQPYKPTSMKDDAGKKFKVFHPGESAVPGSMKQAKANMKQQKKNRKAYEKAVDREANKLVAAEDAARNNNLASEATSTGKKYVPWVAGGLGATGVGAGGYAWGKSKQQQ